MQTELHKIALLANAASAMGSGDAEKSRRNVAQQPPPFRPLDRDLLKLLPELFLRHLHQVQEHRRGVASKLSGPCGTPASTPCF